MFIISLAVFQKKGNSGLNVNACHINKEGGDMGLVNRQVLALNLHAYKNIVVLYDMNIVEAVTHTRLCKEQVLLLATASVRALVLLNKYIGLK